MSLIASQVLMLPALGRPFCLGMLYDARSEKIIPGITLWNKDKLQENLQSSRQEMTNFQIIADDSFDSKATVLDIRGNVKASILCGMVELEGSAKFIDNRKTSNSHSRLSLVYNCTSKFEQLTMSQLATKNIQYPHVIDKADATHVVTGVLFGARAIFVFDNEKTHEENCNNTQAQGEMQAIIECVPGLAVGGEVSIILTKEERRRASSFSCTFHGDLQLPSNPATFDEAVKTYSNLPKILELNGGQYVPMQVWLYPLAKLSSKTLPLVREISVPLLSQTEEYLEQLQNLYTRCAGMLPLKIYQNFRGAKVLLQNFQRMIQNYKVVFQKRLCEILPLIRIDSRKESHLAELLRHSKMSPFQFQRLQDWLNKREKEMLSITAYYDFMNGNVKFANKEELDHFNTNLTINHVVCLEFRLPASDLYLDSMEKYLENPASLAKSASGSSGDETSYCKSVDFLSKKTRSNVRHFREFAEANRDAEDIVCIMTAITADEVVPGAFIILFHHGDRLEENFTPPGKVNPRIKEEMCGLFSLIWDEPNIKKPSEVEKYEICYQTFDTPETTLVSKKANFNCKGVKRVKVRVVCNTGKGAYSDPVFWHCSPIRNIQIVKPLLTCSYIEWEPPSHVARDIRVDSYTLEVIYDEDIVSAATTKKHYVYFKLGNFHVPNIPGQCLLRLTISLSNKSTVTSMLPVDNIILMKP